jgi:2-(1,2-epoxy-1,2-dihydrophenyl)acetyl-CoA isomerase
MSINPVHETVAGGWAVSRHGQNIVATLDRPSVRNALNFACWEQLSDLLEEIDGDPAIRALVLSGGETIFSAGGDMKDVQSRGAGLMKDAARLQYLQAVLVRLSQLSIPTIAAVEGPAVGVAWGLALTCDFVIAGEGATFMAPFAERRLVPDGGIAWHLVRTVGRLNATRILFAGGKLSSAEAFALGLVTEVVASGQALARSLSLGESLAKTSRDTTRLALRALRRAEHTGHRDYLDAELELAALNLHNPEVAAGRMSFKKTAGETANPAKGQPR